MNKFIFLMFIGIVLMSISITVAHKTDIIFEMTPLGSFLTAGLMLIGASILLSAGVLLIWN